MSNSHSMRQLCDDYQRLMSEPGMAGFDMPGLVPTTLKLETEFSKTVEAVEAALSRHGPEIAAGWLRRESWAGPHSGDPGFEAGGAALEGEWALAGGSKSLALLYDGRQFRLITCEDGATDGQPVLREEAQLIGHEGDYLAYAVYWGAPANDPSEIRRLATRLLGVGEV